MRSFVLCFYLITLCLCGSYIKYVITSVLGPLFVFAFTDKHSQRRTTESG